MRWTEHALTQLRNIHNYIAQDSLFYAKRVSDAIVRKTIGLDKIPYMGHKVTELSDEHIREIAMYSYRILYEIQNNEDAVDILAVIHKRQNFRAEDLP